MCEAVYGGGGATGAFCPGPHYVGGPKGQERALSDFAILRSLQLSKTDI